MTFIQERLKKSKRNLLIASLIFTCYLVLGFAIITACVIVGVMSKNLEETMAGIAVAVFAGFMLRIIALDAWSQVESALSNLQTNIAIANSIRGA